MKHIPVKDRNKPQQKRRASMMTYISKDTHRRLMYTTLDTELSQAGRKLMIYHKRRRSKYQMSRADRIKWFLVGEAVPARATSRPSTAVARGRGV